MPFKSKAQQRFMFAAEARGELPEGTARRWAHHTKNIKKLPERVEKRAFVTGFKKVADNLPEEARNLALAPMQDHVAGSTLNENKETAQSRGRATRTDNVQNEDREMNPKYKRKWQNSRIP